MNHKVVEIVSPQIAKQFAELLQEERFNMADAHGEAFGQWDGQRPFVFRVGCGITLTQAAPGTNAPVDIGVSLSWTQRHKAESESRVDLTPDLFS